MEAIVEEYLFVILDQSPANGNNNILELKVAIAFLCHKLVSAQNCAGFD